MTSFKSQMIFSRLPTSATLRGIDEWGMILILFCALVVVQRMQLNCRGFSNSSASKKKEIEGRDNDSEIYIGFSEDSLRL